MLTLTRRPHESVAIAEGTITVTVVRVQGNKVTLAFDAPRDIDIKRAELQPEVLKKIGERKRGK